MNADPASILMHNTELQMSVLTLGMAALIATGPSSVEITVYNQGFGLVKEVRRLPLQKGEQTVAIEDVAKLIEPSSVGIRSLSSPGSFSVLEQSYRFDLIGVQAILDRAVGQRIVFNRILPNGARERIEGVLVSSPSAVVGTSQGGSAMSFNGMVVRTDDGRILLNPSGEIEVTSIPKGLISKPTLFWDIESETSGDNDVELSYLTQGIRWNADYVLTLDGAGKADMKGWVTLDNQSGATYENAKLKLLAGDVQRVRREVMDSPATAEFRAAAGRGGFQQEAIAEYHLYTLQRPTSVRDREIKQVSLLEAVGVPIAQKLVVDATRDFGRWRPSEGEVGTGPIKPLFLVEFTNDQKSNLGMPLPMGKIKVYQRDKSGSVQMLGEDQIEHTPRNERISLAIGRAFDVVAERKRIGFEWIRGRDNQPAGTRETFEIEVRNRKEVAQTVYVIERAWGEFKIVQNSMAFTMLDANTFQFKVDLGADQVTKVVYTLESRWR